MTGEELAARMETLGLTNEVLGNLCEPPVEKTNIAAMRSGKRPIGKVMAHRLKRALAAAARKGKGRKS